MIELKPFSWQRMIEAVEAVRERAIRATAALKIRRKDQMHLLDMISVGLIDATWIEKLPPQHASRLQQLLDDPEG